MYHQQRLHKITCCNRLCWPTFPLGLVSSFLALSSLFLIFLLCFPPWYYLFVFNVSYPTMKLTCDVFESLLSSEGLEVSFSLYHECLHSIAFTHAKVLSLLRHKFIDPSSPTDADRTISIQFLPHWRQVLLLPLFLRLLCLYLKPQLRLSDTDYQLMVDSFDHLLAAEVTEALGVSLKLSGCHLHILWSVTFLEQLCFWMPSDPPLDYFIHIGGDPMIILGDILMQDDVQSIITRLLTHVGSPSTRSTQS